MTDTIDAATALDQFFAVVREEALSNPKFARRLVEATGSNVLFRGEDAKYAVDPVLVAMQGQEAFRTTFLTFKPAELKAMVKDFHLGTAADLKGKTKAPQIVEVMWNGALAKIHDRGLGKR